MTDTVYDFMKTMSIETATGSKVIYMGINGYDGDKVHANKHLVIGQEYEVESMKVGHSSSTVMLKGVIVNYGFNSVMFQNAPGDFEKYDWYGDEYPTWEKVQGWIKEAEALRGS